jgi:membrane-bound serine protease (ClpP class)
MKPARAILLLSLFLLAAPVATAGETVVIPIRDRLGPGPAERIAGEIERLGKADGGTLVIELALDGADGPAGLALARSIAAAPDGLAIVVLVTRAAPGSAVAVLLAADRAFALETATIGPVPARGAVRQAVAAAAAGRDLPLTSFRRMVEPGGLSAFEAQELGIVEQVFVGRGEIFTVLGLDADLAEERQPRLPGPDRPVVRNPRVKGPFEKPFLIPIDREIDTTLATSVTRRVNAAKEAGADLLIFEVDSPGGLVSASMDIGDLVFDAGVPTVMLIFKGAYSGAALVSLAGDLIIMGQGGIIGDCQPIAIGAGGYEVLGEKIQSPLRALFRKYADRNGHPVALAEAMVTQEMIVDRVTFDDGAVLFVTPDEVEGLVREHGEVVTTERIVTEDELFTVHANEAFDLGFCDEPAASREEAFARLGIEESQATRLTESWAEKTSRFLMALKMILFFGGITALYMELKVPGFGVPGAIALVCFALFFSASAIAGITTGLEIALFVLAVFLLILEIFIIPGFGVAGLAGFILLCISLYMASVKYPFPTPDRVWGADTPVNWLFELLGAMALSIVAAIVLSKIFPKTSLGRSTILSPAGPAGSLGLTGSGSADTADRQALLGMRGTALTPLRPAGRVEIEDRPVDAVTEGSFIEPGSKVIVILAEGNRIVVEEA